MEGAEPMVGDVRDALPKPWRLPSLSVPFGRARHGRIRRDPCAFCWRAAAATITTCDRRSARACCLCKDMLACDCSGVDALIAAAGDRKNQ